MKIEQFEDKYLSHFSYAVLSECERKIILIDPGRNPEPYYEYARQENAEITGVIETHSHADFVSCHAELQKATGASIYVSTVMKPRFPFVPFDEGDVIELGQIKLKAINTPGHSDDSICIVLEHRGKDKVIFTGDTLFIGDVGRPDLRETQKNAAARREQLAEKMFFSLRSKLMKLEDDVIVYPAHGAGTLCGKSLSASKSSTIGDEKKSNWALQDMSCTEFIDELTSNQPFIPAYFSYDVEMNISGAPSFKESIGAVNRTQQSSEEASDVWIVDVRDEKIFKKGHLSHSVNIMEGTKFETWLGAIIRPDETFILAAGDSEQLERMIRRTASIGYEQLIEEAFVISEADYNNQYPDIAGFKSNPGDYTIVDVRNKNEVDEKQVFKSSISIPLPELRQRVSEIPTGKPVMVHCAAGYRSAAASSIIDAEIGHQTKVYDLGEAIKEF